MPDPFQHAEDTLVSDINRAFSITELLVEQEERKITKTRQYIVIKAVVVYIYSRVKKTHTRVPYLVWRGDSGGRVAYAANRK